MNTLAFDPKGRWLATGSLGKTARLWQLDIEALLEEACRPVGRNLTQAEWARYLGGFTYQKTCPQFPPGADVAEASWVTRLVARVSALWQ